MGGFFNRLGKTLEQGAKEAEKVAAKAQFEADKMMRFNRAKGEAEAIKRQIEGKVTSLGHEALNLVLNRHIDHPALSSHVNEIKGLQDQLATKEAAVQSINSEQYAVHDAAKSASAQSAGVSTSTQSAAPTTTAAYTPPPSAHPASIPTPYSPAHDSAPAQPGPSAASALGTITGSTGAIGMPGEGQVQGTPPEEPGAAPLEM